MKLNPLDIQLLQSLVISSESQLSSAESLWLPVCLPRVESSAFIHGHISYLNQSSSPTTTTSSRAPKLCLLLLTSDREDFTKCQHIRDTLSERLNKVTLAPVSYAELGVSQVQSFAYYSTKPYCFMYRSWPHVSLTGFSDMVSYVSQRMMSSNLKMMWLQSDRHRVAILGWRTSSHYLFGQFDVTISHSEVIAAASNIVKWVRLEENKIKIKDYQ
ncbi:Vacuolar fusion protein MON1 -like protein A [Halotydeus destructor]|nr:Vacuolar fusion protein MON1 -like protein A [Halotydeus destructor]